MKYFISAFALILIAMHPQSAKAAQEIDLSSPENAYESCYSTVNFETPKAEAEEKIRTCLTPTAQKALLSYAVVGAHFLDSLPSVTGGKAHPEILFEVNTVLDNNGLLSASRDAFKKADLAKVLADMLMLYASKNFVKDMLTYNSRKLENLELSEKTAHGQEVFNLKKKLPVNRLELSFIKGDDNWQINHISHK